MAALVCDICGGKLMAKAGGIFECEYCGMQYDKTRIQEMVQEIKGTVKVEGTVEVKGTVKVEGGVNVESQLKRGHLALEDGKWSKAEKYFDEALNRNAECSEAYWGIICAKWQKRNQDELIAYVGAAIEEEEDFKKILRFVGEAEAEALQEKIAVADKELRQRLAAKRAEIAPAQNLLVWSDGWYGLKNDGTVETETGGSVKNWRGITAIVADSDYITGLTTDGTVVTTSGLEVSDWQDIVGISMYDHLLGLKKDGTVVAAADRDKSEKCKVTKWRNIIAVAAGSFFSVGLKADGTVVTTEIAKTKKMNVSNWRDIVAISAGAHHIVGLRVNGTVVAVGDNKNGECNVSGWSDVVAVLAGEDVTIGLKADGTAVRTDAYVIKESDLVAVTDGMNGIRRDGTEVINGWKLFNGIEVLA